MSEDQTDRQLSLRLVALEREVAGLKKTLEGEVQDHLQQSLQENTYKVVQRTDRALREQLSQIQALIYLRDRIGVPSAPLPATGGWALDARSISRLTYVIQTQKPELVVEAGSGASTIWLGHACESVGAKLVSLEHDSHYFEKSLTAVIDHELENTVDVRHAPLTDVSIPGHSTPWYDTQVVEGLSDVGILIVDGPPATTGSFARYPAFPLLSEKLSHNALVFMDDYERVEERDTLKLWLDSDHRWDLQDTGVPGLGLMRRRE